MSGTVVDENRQAIPNVEIYVKFSEDSPYKTDENGYFEMRFQPGEVYLIFSAFGYEDNEVFVPVSRSDQTIEVQLQPSLYGEIDDIVISSKKTNVGREVIQKVVQRRNEISPWNYPHEVNVYIKTTDEDLRAKDDDDKQNEIRLDEDPFGTVTSSSKSQKLNILEVQINKNYAPGNKVKETRNAYSLIGSNKNMYYQTTVRSDFNFFQNYIELPDIHQNGILSPISNPGILAYKYRLVDKYEEGEHTIYKIRINARSTSTSTFSGYIYVIDSLFMIQKIDLKLEKGNLYHYDYISVYQEYAIEKSINYLTKQSFNYGIKNKKEERRMHTQVVFSDYVFDKEFGKRFFNSEVSATDLKAYERDSSYWEENRKISLDQKEKDWIRYNDSIRIVQNKKEFLDSIDKAFNRVTFLKVAWFGVDIRNRHKKTQWTINSLPIVIRPIFIAGPRIAPGGSFFKKWKNEKYLDVSGELSYGFLNKDVKGFISPKFLYDPFHSGYIRVTFKHDFDALKTYDALTQIYKRSNFIEATALKITHNYELFNGFYSTLSYEFAERRPLTDYKFVTWFDKELNNDTPDDFKMYQAGVIGLNLAYTPQQKYMREPNRKVVLGSKWPTFYAYYERGIPTLFGSDVDFDYLQVGIRQQVTLSSAGTLSYHLKSGEFLSAKSLFDADKKYLRRSDPIWFSNPMYSFQKLDTLIPSIQRIIELHVLYHDNGALLYKIPFMKKARIGLVAGTGFAYIQEANWWHGEILAGMERNFRLTRSILRIGAYYVFSKGLSVQPTHSFKISFSVINNETMKYNF